MSNEQINKQLQELEHSIAVALSRNQQQETRVTYIQTQYAALMKAKGLYIEVLEKQIIQLEKQVEQLALELFEAKKNERPK
jgi:dihydroxyacetone kinase-like predicted kinase